MNIKYIVDSFGINMFHLPYLGQSKEFKVQIHNLELSQFCREINKDSLAFVDRPICVVSNKSILKIINKLCNTNYVYEYNCGKRDIKLFADENIFIFVQVNFKIDEDDVFDYDTLMHFVKNRNIVFFKIVIKQ